MVYIKTYFICHFDIIRTDSSRVQYGYVLGHEVADFVTFYFNVCSNTKHILVQNWLNRFSSKFQRVLQMGLGQISRIFGSIAPLVQILEILNLRAQSTSIVVPECTYDSKARG